ncbi:LysR family transcriptional regulator [Variovorax sp.]|uniref:LysR family transcriptional regulator n=1 Tax=Variovorax sp. TaxID=1871043 RepID=UPI004037A6F7
MAATRSRRRRRMDGAPVRRGGSPRPGFTAGYLNALKAFEAAARHQSFSAAAEELSITPAAVGQLVRSLESWLGGRSSSGRPAAPPAWCSPMQSAARCSTFARASTAWA